MRGLEVDTIYYYVNGRKNGHRKTYDYKGDVHVKSNYINGSEDGIVTVYYDDGSLFRLRSVINGLGNGEDKIYDGKGNLIKHYIYENDELIKRIL